MPSVIRNERDPDPVSIDDVQREAKNMIDRVISDVGKASASRQLILGCTTGWLTGYIMMKVGKAAAVALGGGVILLQVAQHQGYVKINWDRLYKKADELGEAVEASTSKKGPKFLDKVEKFVDRKIDKIEEKLKKKERNVKKWYYRNVMDEEPIIFQEIHVFMACFVAGLAFGMVSGKII